MTHRIPPRLERIAVAVDFSEASVSAATWAAQHFARGVELVLVHVIQPPSPPRFLEKRYPSTDRIIETARTGAEARLRELSASIATTLVWPEIRVGTPDEEIVRVAAEYHADLIVVGRAELHAGGWGRIGTTVQRVLRRSHVPVLLVTGAPPRAPSQLLVAVDDSTMTDRVLSWGEFLGERFSADATAMHAVSVPLFMGSSAVSGGLAGEAADAGAGGSTMDAGVAAEARRWLETRLRDSTRSGRMKALVVSGAVPPADAILEETGRLDDAILVMGSRGAGAAHRLLFGSVAERVLRDAPCPVLVVVPN